MDKKEKTIEEKLNRIGVKLITKNIGEYIAVYKECGIPLPWDAVARICALKNVSDTPDVWDTLKEQYDTIRTAYENTGDYCFFTGAHQSTAVSCKGFSAMIPNNLRERVQALAPFIKLLKNYAEKDRNEWTKDDASFIYKHIGYRNDYIAAASIMRAHIEKGYHEIDTPELYVSAIVDAMMKFFPDMTMKKDGVWTRLIFNGLSYEWKCCENLTVNRLLHFFALLIREFPEKGAVIPPRRIDDVCENTSNEKKMLADGANAANVFSKMLEKYNVTVLTEPVTGFSYLAWEHAKMPVPNDKDMELWCSIFAKYIERSSLPDDKRIKDSAKTILSFLKNYTGFCFKIRGEHNGLKMLKDLAEGFAEHGSSACEYAPCSNDYCRSILICALEKLCDVVQTSEFSSTSLSLKWERMCFDFSTVGPCINKTLFDLLAFLIELKNEGTDDENPGEAVPAKEAEKRELKVYQIPVEWATRGTISVEAHSVKEALMLAYKKLYDIPLPDNGQYLYGSFAIANDDPEEVLNAQTHKPSTNAFIPYDEISASAAKKTYTIDDVVNCLKKCGAFAEFFVCKGTNISVLTVRVSENIEPVYCDKIETIHLSLNPDKDPTLALIEMVKELEMWLETLMGSLFRNKTRAERLCHEMNILYHEIAISAK